MLILPWAAIWAMPCPIPLLPVIVELPNPLIVTVQVYVPADEVSIVNTSVLSVGSAPPLITLFASSNTLSSFKWYWKLTLAPLYWLTSTDSEGEQVRGTEEPIFKIIEAGVSDTVGDNEEGTVCKFQEKITTILQLPNLVKGTTKTFKTSHNTVK